MNFGVSVGVGRVLSVCAAELTARRACWESLCLSICMCKAFAELQRIRAPRSAVLGGRAVTAHEWPRRRRSSNCTGRRVLDHSTENGYLPAINRSAERPRYDMGDFLGALEAQAFFAHKVRLAGRPAADSRRSGC